MKQFLLILLFVIISCKKKEKHPYPRIIDPKQKNVVEVNSREMLQNRSPIIALNYISDRAILKNIDGVFQCNNFKTYNGLVEEVIKNRYDLRIVIDTSYYFTSKGIAFKNLLFSVDDSIIRDSINKPFYKNKLPFSRISAMENQSVVAYPVLFFNNSNKSIPLGKSDLKIKIIQEAKDVDGTWKPIEFFYGDGMCLQQLNLLLESKHYTASAIIKYKGDFKTKIRVKYFDGKNVYYSNEINGTINRSQFNLEYLLEIYRDIHNGLYPRYLDDFKKRIFLNN